MKDKIIEIIAEELLGVIPIHKGPFVSSAEARRVGHHDNKKRFEVAERIATRIEGVMGEWVIKGTKEGLKCRTCGSYFARGLKQDYCPSCNYYSIEKI